MKQWVMVFCVLVAVSGCSSVYYNTMERFGLHKRDILVDRVADARNLQEKGQEQFESALEQFRSIVEVDETNLSKTYSRLNREYEQSKKAAEAISGKIEDIDSVAAALFREWKQELDQYSDARLRRDSEGKMKQTHDKSCRRAPTAGAGHHARSGAVPEAQSQRQCHSVNSQRGHPD